MATYQDGSPVTAWPARGIAVSELSDLPVRMWCTSCGATLQEVHRWTEEGVERIRQGWPQRHYDDCLDPREEER